MLLNESSIPVWLIFNVSFTTPLFESNTDQLDSGYNEQCLRKQNEFIPFKPFDYFLPCPTPEYHSYPDKQPIIQLGPANQ